MNIMSENRNIKYVVVSAENMILLSKFLVKSVCVCVLYASKVKCSPLTFELYSEKHDVLTGILTH